MNTIWKRRNSALFLPLMIICVFMSFLVVVTTGQTKDELNQSLLIAAENDNVATIKELIIKGADINVQDSSGSSALFISSLKGNKEIVNLLLDANADVNTALTFGTTPLAIASQQGHTEIVKRLLEANADVNASLTNGVAPLYVAAQNDNIEIVKLLLKARANVNAVMTGGATPLYIASERGHTEIVRLLIVANANVNTSLANGVTPLMIATQNGFTEVVKLLLQSGANVNAKVPINGSEFTSLQIAMNVGKKEVIDVLTQYTGSKSYHSCVDRTDEPQGMFDIYFKGFDEVKEPISTEKMGQLISVLLVKKMNSIGKEICYVENNNSDIIKPDKGYKFVRIIFDYCLEDKPTRPDLPVLWMECIKLFNNENVYTPYQMISYGNETHSGYELNGTTLYDLNNRIAVTFEVKIKDLSNLTFQVNGDNYNKPILSTNGKK
jgi:ankyrin repeat protein